MSETSLVIRPGAVVVFEGLDRTGKSTQLERLRAAVGNSSTVFAHMPSGFTPFTKSVYLALEGATADERPTSGLAQQLAHLACHAESIRELERAVEMQSLILDRWWWSALAYGWYGGSVEQSGLSEGSFRELIKTIWAPIVPSVVFVFVEPHHVDGNNTDVTCQRDGTTVLPRAWDHLEVLLSIVSSGGGVNADAPALAV